MTVADYSDDLTIDDSIIVGQSGSGSLLIEGNANVTVQAPNTKPPGAPSRESLIIAANAGSTGRVEVDGGAYLTANLVTVGGTRQGAGGSGSLVVLQSNADLRADQIIVWNTGTAIFGGYIITGELDVSGGSVQLQGGSFGVEASMHDANYADPAPGINVTAGGSITGFGTLSVAPTITASYAYGPAIPIANAGLIEAVGGTLALGSVQNSGSVLAAAGGVLDLLTQDVNTNLTDTFANAGVLGTAGGSVSAKNIVTASGAQGIVLVSGGGTVTVGDGTAEFTTLIDAGETVRFEGAGTLSLNGKFLNPINGVNNVGAIVPPDMLLPAIAGFGVGDTISFDTTDSNGVGFGGITSYANGVLSLELIDNNGGYGTLNLDVGTNYVLGQFQLTSANGVTDLTALACYCAGTLILTASGEVAVESVAIGDIVVTASGENRPIKWIGRRAYAGRFLAANPNIQPIRLRAGALGEGLPRRDLLVSPKHAMFLDGVLVPAECLVNGVTILRDDGLEQVAYFHIELDSHDVLLAEGAPSESFVDDKSRFVFHNAHEYDTLFPDDQRAASVYCADRVEDGEVLERIKRAIDLRAGIALPHLGAPLRGHVDGWEGTTLRGWAQNADHPEVPVCLEVLVDGVPGPRMLANRFRADLRAASLGSGCHSFRESLPASAVGRAIEVRRVIDGAILGVIPGRADHREAA